MSLETVTSVIPAQPHGVPPSTITTVITVSPTSTSTTSTSTSSTSTTSSSTTTPTPTSSAETANFGSADTNKPTLPSTDTGSGINAGGTPTTSTTDAGSGKSTSTANLAPSNSSGPNLGLIVGIAVIGALLLIALIALVFLLRRRRRSSRSRAATGADNTGNEVTELENVGNKGRHNITSHEIEQSLLANSGYGAAVPLDDKQVHAKFSKLNQDIKDWVLTHFRNINPRARSTNQDVLRAIQSQPYYKVLLQDPRGKYLVVRGIVADGLTDAFENGEINGFADVFGMKDRFPTNVGAKEKAQWRSSTVALLAKDSGFRDRQERAVESIAERIDYVSSSVTGLEHSDNRLRQLTSLVESAATLALELSKQRMNFVILHPDNTTFDSNIMEDVLQESRGEELHERTVLSVVFPAVVRYGDEHGEGFDRRNIISKALVLTSGEESAF